MPRVTALPKPHYTFKRGGITYLIGSIDDTLKAPVIVIAVYFTSLNKKAA